MFRLTILGEVLAIGSLYAPNEILVISLSLVSALILAIAAAFYYKKLTKFVFIKAYDRYYMHRQKRNLDFMYSITHNHIARSAYFFQRLNCILKRTEFSNIKFKKDKRVADIILDTSVMDTDGHFSVNAIFKRNNMYLNLVSKLSVSELQEWQLFFSSGNSDNILITWLQSFSLSLISLPGVFKIYKLFSLPTLYAIYMILAIAASLFIAAAILLDFNHGKLQV